MNKTHLRRSVSALLICATLLSLCGYAGTSIAAANMDTPNSVQRTYTRYYERVYDAGLGNSISLRGSEYPLTWTAGVEMRNISSDLWEYTTERYSSGIQVEFKPLLNDETWATGNNYTVTAGTTVDIYPTF